MWRRVLQIDCSALTTPDLADVERLARLRLELKRRGCGLRLTNVSPELRDLLAFAGLAGALGLEPLQQQLVVGVSQRRASLVGADVAAGERRACPLQAAVDRGNRRSEQIGHLACLPAQYLAQDEHRALPRRQMLQGSDERQADRVA